MELVVGGSHGQFVVEVLLNRLQEVHRVQVHVGFHVLDAVDAAGQILGHLARVDRVDTGLLQGCAEPDGTEEVGYS